MVLGIPASFKMNAAASKILDLEAPESLETFYKKISEILVSLLLVPDSHPRLLPDSSLSRVIKLTNFSLQLLFPVDINEFLLISNI